MAMPKILYGGNRWEGARGTHRGEMSVMARELRGGGMCM